MVKRMLDFLSVYYWRTLFATLILIIVIIYFFYKKEGVVDLYLWFKNVSYADNANLITISTVLIGIYFSLYTYLLSADTNSFLAKIKSEREFKKLIHMINVGFFSSLSIVMLSFINEELFSLLDRWYILLLFLIFIGIFGSLLEIFLYYSLLFKYDFKKRFNYFQSAQTDEFNDQQLKKKLKEFLEKQDY